jgi:polyisoprenyl-phosphate glycosyltransferase
MTSSVAVVVPVYRNAETLRALAARLDAALVGVAWRLRFVVDACPAGSGAVADALAATDSRIRVSHLPCNAGQHRAIVHGLVAESEADVWVCMDADLQDPPEALPLLLSTLHERRVAGAFAGRRGAYESLARRMTGTLHRRLLSALTGLPVDAGGFFAMERALRDAVVAGMLNMGAPSVVVAAGASGLPLASVPVRRDGRREGRSAWTFRARLRMSAGTLWWAARRPRNTGRACGQQVFRFLVVGAGGTAACLIGYLLLRLEMPAENANVVSRLAVAIPTTWLNGRYTFGTRVSRRRLYGGALVVLAAGTAVSAGLLAVEQSVEGVTDRPAELAALVFANAGATVARFVLLRQWLFRRARHRSTAGAQHGPPAPTALAATNEPTALRP